MRYFFSLLLLLSTLFTKTLFGQNPGPASPEKDRGWVTVGFGAGMEHDFATVINANYGRNKVVQFAYHGSREFSIGNNPDNSNSISINYGISTVHRFTRLAVSAGPSIVFGKSRDENNQKNHYFNTVGLLLNCQAMFTPIKELGVGFDLFYNLNFEQNIAGISLTIAVEGNK